MSPPPGAAPRIAPGPPIFPNADQMFAGLLHFDGMDEQGRPVVIVNARAAAVSDISLRHLAVQYMMQRLDPLVYAVRPTCAARVHARRINICVGPAASGRPPSESPHAPLGGDYLTFGWQKTSSVPWLQLTGAEILLIEAVIASLGN